MRLFTIKETSKILGFSTNTIYKFVNDGTIKGSRAGEKGRIRIPQSSIEAYLGSKLPSKENLTPKQIKIVISKPPLALTAIRILLIIALLMLITDLFLNPNTSFVTQLLRLLFLFVLILLAYQFGGTRKNESNS